MDAEQFFHRLIEDSKAGTGRAICSVCSSNAFVIEAALEEGQRLQKPVLIEATANQVNQFGGYTGMKPRDFFEYVQKLAEKQGFDTDNLILGGDHLGPLVWSGEPEDAAMAKAETLIAAFAEAGFRKIHIDCSMRLGSDDPGAPLPPETVAARAARLAAVLRNKTPPARRSTSSAAKCDPGGSTEAEGRAGRNVPENRALRVSLFRDAFLEAALPRHGSA